MKKYLKRLIEKREKGSSGSFIYFMALVAIFLSVLILCFVQFNANVYVVKSDLENGLHIVENAVMTSNQRYEQSGLYLDNYERELSRMHIITSNDYVGQCEYIGNIFSNTLKEHFSLNDNAEPTTGILYHMMKPWRGTVDPNTGHQSYKTAKILIQNPVIIYEPNYEIIKERIETGDPERPFKFQETYIIKGWSKYSLYFNEENNNYEYVVKEDLVQGITPVLKNGNKCEGSTIEATITVPFYGVNKLFAKSSSATYHQYYVSVTQSTDIVLSSLDSRNSQ